MRQTLTFAVDALAVARLTRLLTKDEIAQPVRDWATVEAYALADRHVSLTDDPEVVYTNDEDPPKLAYLVRCPWCSSAYIAAGVVLARRFVPGLWDPIAHALAFSHLAGLGANLDVET